ncbi:MAG: aldo/keto reductase [Defluviitaleaceae bacterium]|nr:aldo/keto reductase [Defluviitaleaceae bacterium]
MQYRELGKTGFKASLLGLGCMRLPYIDRDDMSKGVNLEEAYELIRYAVDNGVNYFDSAQGYHGGESETILGAALDHNNMREKVWITTKHPFRPDITPDEIKQNLESTLKKLRTTYLDTWLIHGIGPGNWEGIQEKKIMSIYEDFKAQGLIKHIGFSYHGNFDHFKEVVTHYPWDLILGMHNILDQKREVTAEGIKIAANHGIAMAVMEPLRGGGLAHAPKVVQEIYDSFPVKRTPAEWAFRYLANMPGVSTIISGMSNMEQLKENIAIFSQPDMIPGHLTPEEEQLIISARQAYESIITIPCTACNYCIPCPQNVGISTVFTQYNDGHRFGFFDQARRSYMFLSRPGRGVDKCTDCGVCVPKCPHGIDIPAQLKIAHERLKGWNG